MKSGIKTALFAAALAGTLMLSGCKDVSESESSTESSSSTSSVSKSQSSSSAESKPQNSSSSSSSESSSSASSVSKPQSSSSSTESKKPPASTPQSSSTPAESTKPPVIHDPETQALIDEFPYDTFTGFDGKEVKKTDAVEAMKAEGSGMIFLTYDFAYLRYAKPVWKNTLTDPDAFDWETYEFDGVPQRNITDPNYFLVKAGDVLANGLTVTEATSTVYLRPIVKDGVSKIDTWQDRCVVNFEGTLTLNGILRCMKGDSDYIDMDGDLYFYADPSDGKVFVPGEAYSGGATYLFAVDPANKFAVYADGHRFYLGNVNNENTFDLSGIINKGEYQNVTVTLDNVRAIYTEGGMGLSMYGTIVSVDAGD